MCLRPVLPTADQEHGLSQGWVTESQLPEKDVESPGLHSLADPVGGAGNLGVKLSPILTERGIHASPHPPQRALC